VLSGASFTGYDYASAQHSQGTVNGQPVTVYEYGPASTTSNRSCCGGPRTTIRFVVPRNPLRSPSLSACAAIARG
jgi:hypothetical protein